jgi:hypothetical protein
VQVKKYAVALDPVAVARMRDEARLTAVRERRDVSWVALLRAAMDRFLAEAGRADATDAGRPALAPGASVAPAGEK